MRGIRVLQGHAAALSILTTYRERPEDRPYEDDIGADGHPRYKWRGTDAQASDNVALRVAMELRKPLAWFVGVAPGLYEAVFPVWLVDEEPDNHQFVVALDEAMETAWQQEVMLTGPDEVRRRQYALGVIRRRLEYAVEVRKDVLGEKDGPILLHALQGVHGTVMVLPRRPMQRPDVGLLEQRYERFKQAG